MEILYPDNAGPPALARVQHRDTQKRHGYHIALGEKTEFPSLRSPCISQDKTHWQAEFTNKKPTSPINISAFNLWLPSILSLFHCLAF